MVPSASQPRSVLQQAKPLSPRSFCSSGEEPSLADAPITKAWPSGLGVLLDSWFAAFWTGGGLSSLGPPDVKQQDEERSMKL